MGNCCVHLEPTTHFGSEEFAPNVAQRYSLRYNDSIIYSPRKRSPDRQSFDAQWFRKFCVGINIFNTVPRLGIHYLTQEGFLADCPTIVSCFLLNCKGLSKCMIGQFLTEKNDPFASDVLKRLTEQLNLSGMMVDEALRFFQEQFHLSGPAEEVERILAVFSAHYIECNPELVSDFTNPNTVLILACSLFLLDVDIKSMGKRHILTKTEFVASVEEATQDEHLETSDVEEMYKRLVMKPFSRGLDLTTAVENLRLFDHQSKQRINLAEPHRRLVFDCSILRSIDQDYRIYHQVHVFLFNDVIVLAKLNISGTFNHLRTIPLLGLEMETCYNADHSHAVRLKGKPDDKVILTVVTYTEFVKKELVMVLSEMIIEAEETHRVLSEYLNQNDSPEGNGGDDNKLDS